MSFPSLPVTLFYVTLSSFILSLFSLRLLRLLLSLGPYPYALFFSHFKVPQNFLQTCWFSSFSAELTTSLNLFLLFPYNIVLLSVSYCYFFSLPLMSFFSDDDYFSSFSSFLSFHLSATPTFILSCFLCLFYIC